MVNSYLASLGAPVSAPSSSGGHGGVFGFLGNLAENAEDLVYGLGGIAAQGVHDVGRVVAQAVPGKEEWGFVNDVDPTGYHVDDILKALPSAIAGDYAKRYGGISNIKTGLYNEPLSYILDVLGLGSMVGKGAKMAGALALEAPEAAGARAIATGSADALKAVGLTEKVANPAGIKAGLEALAEQRPLSKIEQMAHDILPSSTARRVGDELLPYARPNNPVLRAATKPLQRFTQEPLEAIRARADSLTADIAAIEAKGNKVPGSLLAEYNKQANLLTGAEKFHLSRVQTPFISDKLLWLKGKGEISAAQAAGLNNREGELKRVIESMKPYYDEDPEFSAKMVGAPDGLNVELHAPGLQTQEWFTPERVGGITRDVPLAQSGTVKTRLATELEPRVREIAALENPKMLESADRAAEGVRSWLQDIMSNPEHFPEGRDPAALQDAAERYVSMRYDAVNRMVQHVRADSGVEWDITSRATDSMRELASERELEMLGKGDDIEHIMERIYEPMQFKYGGMIDDEGRMANAPDWRSIDDSMRAANVPPPVYFGYIDESARGNWYEYLTNKTRIGGRKMARDPNMKYFSGSALEKGTYITDPLEALSRRAVRYSRAKQVQNFIDYVVKPNSRRITDASERAASEGLWAPDGAYRMFKKSISLQDTVDHLTSAGVDEHGLADALGKFLFKNSDELEMAGFTGKGMELYAVPNTIIRQVENYAKASGLFNTPGVRLFWDGPANVWRSLVLQGSPRWILNNTLGNVVMQKLTGYGAVRDMIQIAEARWRQKLAGGMGKTLDDGILDDLNRVPGMNRVGGGFSSTENLYNQKLGSLVDSRTGEFYERLSGSKPVSALRKYGNFNQWLNGAVEEVGRQATYLSALERQSITAAAHPVARHFWSLKTRIEKLLNQAGEITEPQINAALKDLGNTLGDYKTLLGPVEKNVIRRFVFPFWGFYKHQGMLLARLPIDNPIRADVIRLLGEVNQEMLEQYGPIPDWLEGSIPMGPPGPEVAFLSSRGPNPLSASFESPISMLNPVVKLAAERALGRNLYTGETYQGAPEDYYTPFGSDQQYRYVRDGAGNIVDAVPVEGHVEPALWDQILETIPQYSAVKEAIAGGKTYDTSTLLDVIRARMAGRPEAAADMERPTTPIEQLLRLAGLTTTKYPLGSYQESLAAGREQALSAAGG